MTPSASRAGSTGGRNGAKFASKIDIGVAPGASDAFAASTFSREYFIATASKAGSALAI